MRPLPTNEEKDYADLKRALLEVARQPEGRLVYLPNPGNAGDALIASATWQLFDELFDEPPLILPIGELRRGDRLIYGGGGLFVPHFPIAEQWLRCFAATGLSRLLILPHTFRGMESALAEFGPECVLFCREWVSYETVSGTAKPCQVRFAPDMALRLDIHRLRTRVGRAGFADRVRFAASLPFSSKSRRLRRWRRKLAAARPDAQGVLQVFRADAERTGSGDEYPRSADISDFYGSQFLDRAEADQITSDLLDRLDAARLVETNRLHVGIGAALLGKQVVLHDNSYGKIRAIYEASLQDWPNVSFAG